MLDFSRQTSRAFSLVELTLVVAIISIAAAITIPHITTSIQNYEAISAAKRIVADLAMAQSRAFNTSSTQTIVFTLGNSSYQILGMSDPDRPTLTYTVYLANSPYNAALVSVTFSGATQISFTGFGVPSSGGTIVVSAGSQQHTITIDSSNGMAVIQ